MKFLLLQTELLAHIRHAIMNHAYIHNNVFVVVIVCNISVYCRNNKRMSQALHRREALERDLSIWFGENWQQKADAESSTQVVIIAIMLYMSTILLSIYMF